VSPILYYVRTCGATAIAHETKFVLDTEDAQLKVIEELKRVKKKLGEPGAANRAAQAIHSFLS